MKITFSRSSLARITETSDAGCALATEKPRAAIKANKNLFIEICF
jgi:hypothetical protein